MTPSRTRGDHANGAVPPLVLTLVGLLMTLVAGLGLVLQAGGSGDTGVSPRVTAPAVPTGATAHDVPLASMIPAGVEPTAAPAPTTRPAGESGRGEVTTASTAAAVAPSTTEAPAPSTTEAPAPSTTEAAVPSTSSVSVPTGSHAQAAAVPSWISIASARVDGSLTPRGLAPNGTINPARNEIMYFTGSGRVAPGEVGTAVIAAHVTWEGRPDAFVDLHAVVPGDVVTVGYSDGTSRSFPVTSTAVVDKDQLSRSDIVWGAHPDRPRLAIITCDPTLGYQSDGHAEANFLVIAEA